MDFFDVLKKRRSTRHFLPGKTIPEGDLIKLIEWASLTPSGYNAQPWEFVIIRDEERLKKLQEIAFAQPKIAQASAVILVVGDTNMGRNADEILDAWVQYGYCTEGEKHLMRDAMTRARKPEKKREMALRNATLAAMTLMFAAEAMGYATCPMMGFKHADLEPFINMPDDRVISMMVAIGYADTQKQLPRLPRKKPETMIHWEAFPQL